MKKSAAFLLCFIGVMSFAGLIDEADLSQKPRVLGRYLEYEIARKHFPETSCCYLEPGKSRSASWKDDIRKAAAGLDIKSDELDKFIKSVIDAPWSDKVKAPHAKLLEFELYAAGRRDFLDKDYNEMPPNWKKLLALPKEQRLYTTIPVWKSFSNLRKYRSAELKEREKILAILLDLKKQGYVDTQGCVLNLVNDVSRNPHDYKDWATAYRMMFRKIHSNCEFLVYTDEYKKVKMPATYMDWVAKRWEQRPDVIWSLFHESEENLRKMCQTDPVMRDFIVCIGISNGSMPRVEKVAWEFFRQSPVNYPLAAVNLPVSEGAALLKDYPQHSAMRDMLIISSLEGTEKIAAIDKYIEKYPDFASLDNELSYTILFTDSQLHAFSGAELFRLGRIKEAAERWVNGCYLEDIGMIAEQVMTLDELQAFCDKHFSDVVDHDVLISECKTWICSKKELHFFIRNLLARRLMRVGKYAVARKYFTGPGIRKYSEKFFAMQKIADSAKSSREEKTTALLNMAAIMRFHGDILYGTLLEPDNLINGNRCNRSWGYRQNVVKLNKPELPRYSYRYRAAELYGKAAATTADSKVRAYALWTAGSVLKNLSPKHADVYFKKLYAVAPHLTVNNWFLPIRETPLEVKSFYLRRIFFDGKIADYTPAKPYIKAVELPVKKDNLQELTKFLKKNKEENFGIYNVNSTMMYALMLSGELGSIEADIDSAKIQYDLNDYESALWFIRRAEKHGASSNELKYELGKIYCKLGFLKEGVELVKSVADADGKDTFISGKAAYDMAMYYLNGFNVESADAKIGKFYLDKAVEANNVDAKIMSGGVRKTGESRCR